MPDIQTALMSGAGQVHNVASVPPDMQTGFWAVHWIPLGSDTASGDRILYGTSGAEFVVVPDAGGGGAYLEVRVSAVVVVNAGPFTYSALQGAGGNKGITFQFSSATGVVQISGATTGDGLYYGPPWTVADGTLHIGRGASGSPCEGHISAPFPGSGEVPAALVAVYGAWTALSAADSFAGNFTGGCSQGGAVFFCAASAATIQRLSGPLGTFETLTVPGTYSGALFAMTSDGATIVAAAVGRFLVSDDAGDTWADVDAGSYSSLIYSVAAHGAGAFFAGGATGQILESTDSGATWATNTTISGAPSFTACASDGSVVVFAGSGAAIVTSGDDGATWDDRTAPASYTGDYYGACAHAGRLYLCGSGGAIHSTGDGGATWEAHAAAVSYAGLFYSFISDGTDLIVAGQGAEIQRSSNDGSFWQREITDGPISTYLLAGASAGGVSFSAGEDAEVQFSGDPAEPFVYGVSAWLDASGLPPGTGAISVWPASAGGRPATQATPANQPAVSGASTPLAAAFGSAEYLEIPDHADLNFGTGSFLVAMAIRRPQVASYQCLWGKGSSSSADNIRGLINSSHKLHLFWGSDAQSYTASASSVPDDVDTVVMWGIDASANEVIYVIDGAIQRVSVTRSGTGSNALAMRIHGDTSGAYATDTWDLYDWQAYKFGSAEAIADATITAVYDDIVARKGF